MACTTSPPAWYSLTSTKRTAWGPRTTIITNRAIFVMSYCSFGNPTSRVIRSPAFSTTTRISAVSPMLSSIMIYSAGAIMSTCAADIGLRSWAVTTSTSACLRECLTRTSCRCCWSPTAPIVIYTLSPYLTTTESMGTVLVLGINHPGTLCHPSEDGNFTKQKNRQTVTKLTRLQLSFFALLRTPMPTRSATLKN